MTTFVNLWSSFDMNLKIIRQCCRWFSFCAHCIYASCHQPVSDIPLSMDLPEDKQKRKPLPSTGIMLTFLLQNKRYHVFLEHVKIKVMLVSRRLILRSSLFWAYTVLILVLHPQWGQKSHLKMMCFSIIFYSWVQRGIGE